jgi:thiamine biosynthesis lipoprotein
MLDTRITMGMPVTVEVVDPYAEEAIEAVFAHFVRVDERFSTYKPDSEISRINTGRLRVEDASDEMRSIFDMADATRRATDGYFDITHNGSIDPSGIVKGWAIQGAAGLLRRWGFHSFYVDAGGDIQVAGASRHGVAWRVGIRNPFDARQIVKVLAIGDGAVATSGTSIRGQHIYDPYRAGATIDEIVSLTVIGSNILDADRFATAAFAMGRPGIAFIETLPGFEGYLIDVDGRATYTSGFMRYVDHG